MQHDFRWVPYLTSKSMHNCTQHARNPPRLGGVVMHCSVCSAEFDVWGVLGCHSRGLYLFFKAGNLSMFMVLLRFGAHEIELSSDPELEGCRNCR